MLTACNGLQSSIEEQTESGFQCRSLQDFYQKNSDRLKFGQSYIRTLMTGNEGACKADLILANLDLQGRCVATPNGDPICRSSN